MGKQNQETIHDFSACIGFSSNKQQQGYQVLLKMQWASFTKITIFCMLMVKFQASLELFRASWRAMLPSIDHADVILGWCSWESYIELEKEILENWLFLKRPTLYSKYVSSRTIILLTTFNSKGLLIARIMNCVDI